MTTNLKLFLSEPETCEALGIKRSLLRRMMAEDRIQPTHIGRRLVFHIDEVRRFADDRIRASHVGRRLLFHIDEVRRFADETRRQESDVDAP